MPAPQPSRRLSYLLRLWRAGNGDAPQWRCSIEDTQTHERHGFSDLAGLVAYLEEQIQGKASAPPPAAEGSGQA